MSASKLFSALGVCFFGPLLLAAAFFPQGYDWRHTVISSLASPRDNPRAYGIACLGLAISGLLLALFPAFLQASLKPYAPRLAVWAGRLFLLAALFLTLSALIVPGHYRILGLGRSHEHLAQISSVAFCLALLLYFGAMLQLPAAFAGFRRAVAVMVILPVAGFVLCRSLLFFTYLMGSSDAYRAAKLSPWNSLALWEWIGAVSLYFFLGLMTFIYPRVVVDRKT